MNASGPSATARASSAESARPTPSDEVSGIGASSAATLVAGYAIAAARIALDRIEANVPSPPPPGAAGEATSGPAAPEQATSSDNPEARPRARTRFIASHVATSPHFVTHLMTPRPGAGSGSKRVQQCAPNWLINQFALEIEQEGEKARRRI